MKGAGVTPSVNRSVPPKFSEMDSAPFEEMTCALVDKIDGVTRADLFRTQRQPQFGIDVFGETPKGLIVASCKCYAVVDKGEVAQWSNDFLKHWDSHWHDKKILRFILAVAAPMNSKERLADIDEARALFKTKNVEYEVWAPRQLQERLRDHTGIVSEYLGHEWVERICGKSGDFSSSAASDTPGADSGLREQLLVLIKAVSGDTESKLEAARASLDRGRIDEVEETLLALRTGPVWPNIEPRVQGQAVRLQASLALERGDLDGAEAFADEADAITPADEPRLKALLTLRREGAKRGLEVLGEPLSDAGRRLAAAMYLELGDIARVEEMLGAIAQDAEFYRLRTYLCLYQGDSDGALKAALQAEAIDREIVGVVRVGAIARYASALSPRAGALYMTQPQPIARMFVRADDAATARLEEALKGLEGLTSLEADPRFRASDDLWRLACLSNLEGRGGDAEALAQSMLDADVMNVAVIGWCVSRNLAFDRARSLSALRAAYDDGSIVSDGVRALEWLWPDESEEDLTAILNARAGASFKDPQARGEIDALLERLKGAGGDDAGRVQWAAVEAARQSGDWSSVEAMFDRIAGQGGFEPALLFLGEELMSGGAAEFVFERRDALLAFATSEAARLVIYAAINAEEPKAALELMESQVSLFPGARLPYDLRRVEMTALSALGEAPKALEKAKALAAESNSPADKLLEANIHITLGDLGGAASAVRVALERQAVAPRAALMYADQFASAEPELARELWRAATANSLDDHLSMAALTLSFRLGVEDERPDLFGAMHRLAAKNDEGVRVASIDEFIEQFKDAKKREDEFNRFYRIGAAPVHSVLAAAHGDLAALYALQVQPGAHAVLLRNGARPASVPFAPIESWRLRMDITALLVADALDLLDALETLPHPIALGHNLPVLLAAFEQKTQFHQPSRVVAARRVLKALGTGEIDASPPPDGTIAVVFDVEDHKGPAVNLATVLDALRRAGAVEARQADEIIKREGWRQVQGPTLEAGAELVFEDHGLETVADAGVLDAVTRTFKVYASDDAIQPCRDLDAAGTGGDARAARLAALRSRLNAGIAKGKYRLLPARKADDDEDDLAAKALHEQLFSVMHNTGDGELVWFDDRHLSGYPNVERGFVIGVTDVLVGLRASGRLDEAGYFDRLARLRGAGALFIPVAAEEIQYQLRQAPLIDGAIVETPGLAALRRNFALMVLNEENLKTSEMEADLRGRPLEIPIYAENRRVADNAVLAAWRDEPNLARARAHANWIWETLRIEHAKFDANFGAGFSAPAIASLPASALLLTQQPGEARLTRLRAFMDWFGQVVIGQRFTRDPALACDVAHALRTYLLSGFNDSEHAGDRGYVKAITHLVRRLIALLPDGLRLDVLKDEDFRRKIQFKGEPAITLDGVQIPPRRLWRAAQNAVRHRHGALKTSRRKKLRLKVRPAEPRVMRFDGALKGRLHEPALALLDRNTPEVRAEIAALLAGADVPAAERDALAAEWRKLWPHLRMEAFHNRRDASVPNYLHGLYEKLSKAKSIDITEFSPPSTSAWLDFLRWPRGDAGSEASAVAAEILTRELGAETAFERMSACPFRLPKDVLAAVKIDIDAWASPMHALHGMAALGEQDAADAELNRGADALAAMRQSHGALFMTLLHWASHHFEARDDWRTLLAPARHQVLWSAADQLTRVIARAGAAPDFAQRFFDELHVERPILPALDLLAGYHDTGLDTRYLRIESLLLFGLMDALGDAQWAAVMSQDRQKAWLDQLGMEHESGKKSLRPMRSFDGEGHWLDSPDWRDRGVEGATDGEALFGEALAKLEADPNDRDAWVSVSAFGLPVTAGEYVDRINAVLARVDLAKIAVDDDKLLAVRLIAEVVSRIGRGAQADAYLKMLLDLARAQRSSDADETVVAILEAALTGARGFEPGVGLTRLVDFVSRLVQVWPAAAPQVQRIFLGLIEQAPARGAAPLWRPLWAARLL